MVNLLWVKQEFTSGISGSKMAVKTLNTLKMTNAPSPQHINNWWKRGKSERNGYERSPNHIQRRRWWCWHIDWLMPWNLWKNNSWLLHHDNVPAYTSLLVREFLAKNNTVTMPQPQYSPNIAPCEFFLFSKIKRTLKGRRFTSAIRWH